MGVCANLYEEERRKSDRDLCPYREYVLNLLSLHDQTGLSDTVIPGSSLEDFLWGNLWFVHWSPLLSRSCAGASVPRQRSVENGEMALYDKILEYGGADYFDSDLQAPFKYATVLLCCHR